MKLGLPFMAPELFIISNDLFKGYLSFEWKPNVAYTYGWTLVKLNALKDINNMYNIYNIQFTAAALNHVHHICEE